MIFIKDLSQNWERDYESLYYKITPAVYYGWDNTLIIYEHILGLNKHYLNDIKMEINKIIEIHNPAIQLSNSFKKENIKKLPKWLKNILV